MRGKQRVGGKGKGMEGVSSEGKRTGTGRGGKEKRAVDNTKSGRLVFIFSSFPVFCPFLIYF